MPRLFLIRHGETEWTINGRHTGRSDIPLTENGVRIIENNRGRIIGPDKLIKPQDICHVFVSPRQRAQTTFHKLFEGQELPPHDTTESVREWDYGDYEGLTMSQIKVKNPTWVIWKDGCPGGESPEDITKRIDDTIAKVREFHRQYKEEGIGKRDMMIVAHGHFLRAFISRWVEFHVCLGTHFNVEPASVALLTYQHNNLAEPSLTGLNLYAFGD
ncbi:phosphoglycerate mutase-like protein [Serendipita vermifera]|nr:phosphoglycerate mutase-like protein [Serendipita vermifera]